jgi:hypothetical protein
MSNTFRYFNLTQLTPGQYNGLGISWDVKRTVDLTGIGNFGALTGGNDDFEHKGAGLEHGVILGQTYSLGGLSADTTTSIDYGSIA